MMLNRRRFLTICASLAAFPAHSGTHSWHGRALGAQVSLTIHGPRTLASAALSEARKTIREIEQLFSLYDPNSALSRLNATGQLSHPDPRFYALMQSADHAYNLTHGLFDPTVQPLWHALANNTDTTLAKAAIGWDRVQFTPAKITLDTGQSLTFNGIAQGFATDLIMSALSTRGFTDMLVNIGEYRATGGPWVLGISDPKYGHMGTRTLTSGAIATSSPSALSLGDHTHILHPTARPKWSTVSVEAQTATLADSLSTALTLADRSMVRTIARRANLRKVTLVDMAGDLTSL